MKRAREESPDADVLQEESKLENDEVCRICYLSNRSEITFYQGFVSYLRDMFPNLVE